MHWAAIVFGWPAALTPLLTGYVAAVVLLYAP